MTVTRQLSIVYGSLTMGGSTARLLDGPYRLFKSAEGFELAFEFMTVAASDAAMATERATVEAALATPRQDLTVTVGVATFLSLTHTNNVALNIRCEFEAVEEDASARHQRYRVRITGGLPANTAGLAGRRDLEVEIVYTAARYRSARFLGTYTAVSSTQALAQYQAQIDARVATILSELGGTWQEVTPETVTRDDTDQVVQFSRSYREQRPNEARLGDSQCKGLNLQVRRSSQAPGDFDPATRRPDLVTVGVTAIYDKEDTTDLTTKWEALISLAADRARAVSGAGGLALVSNDPDEAQDENVLTGSLTFLALVGGSLLASRLTQAITDEKGVVIREAWDDDTLAAYVFDGPRRVLRVTVDTRTVTGRVAPEDPAKQAAAPGPNLFGIGNGGNFQLDFGGALDGFGIGDDLLEVGATPDLDLPVQSYPDGSDGGGGGAAAASSGAPTWLVLTTQTSADQRTQGLEPYTYDVTDLTTTTVERLVKEVSSAAGASGGAPEADPQRTRTRSRDDGLTESP